MSTQPLQFSSEGGNSDLVLTSSTASSSSTSTAIPAVSSGGGGGKYSPTVSSSSPSITGGGMSSCGHQSNNSNNSSGLLFLSPGSTNHHPIPITACCNAISPMGGIPLTTDTEWFHIKCDDKVFSLQRSTLTSVPGTLFDSLFGEDGVSLNALVRDDTHPLRPYVFDRNPKYVEPVFNFLRNGGELVIDPGVSPYGVLLEAQYFAVQPVVDILTIYAKVENPFGPPSAPTSCGVAPPSITRSELERILMTTASGSTLRFRGMNLQGLDLSGLDLSCVNFSLCNLTGVDFSKTELHSAKLHRCQLQKANFTGSNMCRVLCTESDLTDAVLVGAVCVASSFAKSKMRRVNFSFADFADSNLDDCDMTEANLTGMMLKGATLKRACLVGVERQGTSLTMGGVLGGLA